MIGWIELAMKNKWTNVTIKTDSQTIASNIKKKSQDRRWRLRLVLQVFDKLVMQLSSLKVNVVRREANRLADWFAK